MQTNPMPLEYTAEEYAAAYALYVLETGGAEQDSIDTVWQTEEHTRYAYIRRAQAVIQAWMLKAGECSEAEEAIQITPEQQACIDILAACQGHDLSHVCCGLIVAAVDQIATGNQNKGQATLVSYLNFNNALMDAQHATLDELFAAEGKENPLKDTGENDDDLMEEFLA